MQIRIRFKRLGGHIHCRFFLAKRPGSTFAKCGDLCFTVDEWDGVRAMLHAVEFIEDEA